MPLLRINATDRGLELHDTGSEALAQIAQPPSHRRGPAIIMIHGYKYNPRDIRHCPHGKLFNTDVSGWPVALGFDDASKDKGLGVAFGWSARGPLKQVHRRATMLGASLAQLVQSLKDRNPDRPVHVIAHSLGSEIALSALADLAPRTVDRIVLLTGASFSRFADEMLTTPAGRSAEVFNITSRENDIFDFAFETLVGAPRTADRALGQGIDQPNVANIQLDCDRTLAVLEEFGARVAASERHVCHWSSYKRPGIMDFYAKLLRQPHSLPFDELQRCLPNSMAPRWSRLTLAPLSAAVRRKTSEAVMTTTRIIRRRAALLTSGATEQKSNEPAY